VRLTVAALAASALLAATTAAAGRVVTVDVSRSLGALNRQLGGVTQGSANPAVNTTLASIGVPHIRIDTWFDLSGVDCVNPPDFTALDARVANVRAAGAEPLAIIDYMPACLSRYTGPRIGGQPDPTRHPPANYDQWEALVYATVHHLARDLGVRWFEAWNEPDFPQFFQGTILEYLEIFDRIESVVRRVETEESVALRLGGPAALFPDPLWMLTFLTHVALENRKLDFVSWHWYASYPLFGPIVTTPLGTIPPFNVENPLLKPRDYADHTAVVRLWVSTAWALRTDGAALPLLWINEWNLNSGRDPRHDTAEDAAFAAAALDWMLRGGLDRASFFNVEDSTDPNFNQGMFFNRPGEGGPARPKPVFSTFEAWSRLEDERVALSVGPVPDLGVDGFEQFLTQQDNVGGIATRSADGKRLTILLYNWSPRLKRHESLEVRVMGACGAVTPIVIELDDPGTAFLDVALP
jgi:hypothetical protein